LGELGDFTTLGSGAPQIPTHPTCQGLMGYIYIYIPMWGGYLIFVIPTGSLNFPKKIIRIKEPPVLSASKLQRIARFHEKAQTRAPLGIDI